MPDLTDEQIDQLATEVAEAVPALRSFFKQNRTTQVKVIEKIGDKMFGTDDTAQLRSVPGLTPEMFEMLTDMLLPMGSSVVLKFLVGDETPDPADPV